MVSLARSGKRVVRLKSGDPMIFGRAGEEIAALRAAPASPSRSCPASRRRRGRRRASRCRSPIARSARRVQFVTGHAHDGRLPDDLDLAALADPDATTAVYMPLGTLAALVERLHHAGVEPDRPACAVFNATRPDETVVEGTVATLAGLIAHAGTRGPCMVLIGSVLSARVAAEAETAAVSSASG